MPPITVLRRSRAGLSWVLSLVIVLVLALSGCGEGSVVGVGANLERLPEGATAAFLLGSLESTESPGALIFVDRDFNVVATQKLHNGRGAVEWLGESVVFSDAKTIHVLDRERHISSDRTEHGLAESGTPTADGSAARFVMNVGFTDKEGGYAYRLETARVNGELSRVQIHGFVRATAECEDSPHIVISDFSKPRGVPDHLRLSRLDPGSGKETILSTWSAPGDQNSENILMGCTDDAIFRIYPVYYEQAAGGAAYRAVYLERFDRATGDRTLTPLKLPSGYRPDGGPGDPSFIFIEDGRIYWAAADRNVYSTGLSGGAVEHVHELPVRSDRRINAKVIYDRGVIRVLEEVDGTVVFTSVDAVSGDVVDGPHELRELARRIGRDQYVADVAVAGK